MNKKYGICNISYDEERFEVLVEYKRIVSKDKRVITFVGKDLVTGTPIYSIPVMERRLNIIDAAMNGQIKEGYLIGYNFYETYKEDIIRIVESMYDVEKELYAEDINRMKSKYLEALKSVEKVNKLENRRVNGIIKCLIKK
jgi:hypothetical protein